MGPLTRRPRHRADPDLELTARFPRVTLGRDREVPEPFVAMQEGLSESVPALSHVTRLGGPSSGPFTGATQETPAPAEPGTPPSSTAATSSGTTGATTDGVASAPPSSVDLVVDVVDVAAPPLPMVAQTTADAAATASNAVVAAQGPVPDSAVLPTTGVATGTEVLVAVVVLVAGLTARLVGRRSRPVGRPSAV